MTTSTIYSGHAEGMYEPFMFARAMDMKMVRTSDRQLLFKDTWERVYSPSSALQIWHALRYGVTVKYEKVKNRARVTATGNPNNDGLSKVVETILRLAKEPLAALATTI